MKVFIYEKKGSKKVMEIANATVIIEVKLKHEIRIHTNNDEFKFDMKRYKAVIYQN